MEVVHNKKKTNCWCRGCIPEDSGKLFLLQAAVVWCLLCLPGNIVTICLYYKVSPAEETLSLEASEEMTEAGEQWQKGGG